MPSFYGTESRKCVAWMVVWVIQLVSLLRPENEEPNEQKSSSEKCEEKNVYTNSKNTNSHGEREREKENYYTRTEMRMSTIMIIK